MGKIVILFIFLIGVITTSILTGVNDRSEEIPKMLNGNFQDIGSYAMQYAMNQILTGQVTDNTTVDYSNNKFEVLDGKINNITYNFKSTTTSADFLEDNPYIEGEDEGVFVYEISTTSVGELNINPGNSDSNEFQMQTPGLYVDRTMVHQNAPEFIYPIPDDEGLPYYGPASRVSVKPKAQGRTLLINGVEFELNTNARYTINSNNMMVHLYNDHIKNGKAMGQWWIDIDAENATLELDPGTTLEDFAEDITWYVDDALTQIDVEIFANISMEVRDETLTHDSRAGAVILVTYNEDAYWWTSNSEDGSYKIVYWNP